MAKQPSTRVWDLPLRVFHWTLASAFVVAFLTGDAPTRLAAHVAAGAVILVLLVFRAWWSLAGTRWARARELLVPAREVRVFLARLRTGDAPAYAGHTPLAAWAALAALVLLGALTITGALTLAGEEQASPLAGIVDVSTGITLHGLHRILAWAGVGWVGLHLAGVAKESLRLREPLPVAMVTGRKPGRPVDDVPTRPWVAAALAAAALAVALLPAPVATKAAPMPVLAVYTEECGSCHLAFDPALLPARSWDRMLTEQDRHFGEDLSLDPAIGAELRGWLMADAAEAARNESAVRIVDSVPAGESPQRVTELPWWAAIHADIEDATWDQTNISGRLRCGACHPDAEEGRFDPTRVAIPDPTASTPDPGAS